MEKLSTRGYGLDITPNSRDYPREKCMVLVRKINFQILGVKELNYYPIQATILKYPATNDVTKTLTT